MDSGLTLFGFAYVIILIVPGIIFKRFFFQGAFSGQFNSGLFADRIITSLFWGILVQIISVLTFSRIINISYPEWQKLIQTLYQNLANNKLPEIPAGELLSVLFYAIYSVTLAATLGFITYKLIRWFSLDLKIPAFRFLNQWHYYFRGEILRTPEFKISNRGKVISTEVDLMLKTDDGKSNLFSGLLTQYTLNTKNELDTLYLTGTNRFSQSQNAVKNIPGDIFIVPFSTVQNLNIRYNFQVRQRSQVGKYIIISFAAVLLVGSIVYPWYIPVSFFRKLFGSLILFLSWLTFTSLLISYFPPAAGTQALSRNAKIVNFVILLLLLLAADQILRITPFLKIF